MHLSRLLTGDVIEGFDVVEAASPNMTVVVNPGSALIPTGTYPTSYAYEVFNDTTGGESVTVGTADTSNPRIDLIVAYVDTGLTATSSPANNPGMLKLADVAGTPNATPVAPDSAAIQAAIGAANPYIILAQVYVGANVTQILTSNITDERSIAAINVGTQTYNPYKFSVYQANSQTILTSPTVVAFDTPEFDTGSNVDLTTNKGRVSGLPPGFYSFAAGVSLAPPISTTTRVFISLFKNDAEYKRGDDISITDVDYGILVSIPFVEITATTDYIDVRVQAVGHSITTNPGKATVWFAGGSVNAR